MMVFLFINGLIVWRYFLWFRVDVVRMIRLLVLMVFFGLLVISLGFVFIFFLVLDFLLMVRIIFFFLFSVVFYLVVFFLLRFRMCVLVFGLDVENVVMR